MSAGAFGFSWGPMEVTRIASIDRPTGKARLLGVRTGRDEITVYVTPTGLIRVYKGNRKLVAQ